jgi:hypothetical protein
MVEVSDSMKLMAQALINQFDEHKGELWFSPDSRHYFALSNRKAEIDEVIADLQQPITNSTKPAHVVVINAGVAKLIRQSVKSYTDSIPKLKGRKLASYAIIED